MREKKRRRRRERNNKKRVLTGNNRLLKKYTPISLKVWGKNSNKKNKLLLCDFWPVNVLKTSQTIILSLMVLVDARNRK